MKLTWKQIEPFVKNPDPVARVILVYGPDNGLMKERAKTIGKTIVADLNDPFNAVTLNSSIMLEDTAKLSDEAASMSMMGGARLIRIEDASDKITSQIKDYLKNPSTQNLIILEAGELGPKSTLRQLCEKDKQAAALPCYIEDERDLGNLIRDSLRDGGYRIAPDAVGWLAANIAGDRARARNEIEKLITYMGEEKTITIEHVMACHGVAGVQSLENLVYGTAGNQPQNALKAFHVLIEEGIPGVTVLRSLQNHFRRLHLTKSRIQQGEGLDEAVKRLTPPIFFKQVPAFKQQVQRWDIPTLNTILSRLAALEAECKQTGTPVETLCSQAILGISAR